MFIGSDFSGTEKPLVAGFMRGYRAWRPAPVPYMNFPAGDGEKLRASNYDYAWTRGRNTASCANIINAEKILAQLQAVNVDQCFCEGCGGPREMRLAHAEDNLAYLQGHQVPSSGVCTSCGFYALHDLYQFRAAVTRNMYIDHDATIHGSIKATGTIVIGTKGFRAQYAEIEALAGPYAGPYAEYYGVPWFPEGLEFLAGSFPSTPVEGVDECDGDRDCGHGLCTSTVLAAVNKVTFPSFSPPITALVPNPDSAESHHNGPVPELDAPAPMGPVPMDPEPAEWLKKWFNPRVWRRG